MKFVIKMSYSLRLEYADFDEFTTALGTLINGGLKEFDVIVEEVEA